MSRFAEYAPLLLTGFVYSLWLTFAVSVIGIALAMCLGVLLAGSHRRTARSVQFFVDFVRGLPFLVVMFWLFYGLPTAFPNIRLPAELVAIGGLSLYGGCYGAEVVRGVFAAIPKGQRDAAHALHLPWRRRLFRIMLPQMAPLLLPRFANLSIEQMKVTAIVSFISLHDLAFWSGQIRRTTGETEVVYLATLVLYFVIALLLSLIFRGLEALTPLRRIERARRRRTQTPGGHAAIAG